MDEDLEEALRAAAAEHPPDHQALLDALEAMASEHTTPPTASEHHHDDDLHLGPDIFELLKGEQYNEPERVHQEPGHDTTGAAPTSTPTEPHPAQPSESRHQSQSVDLHQDASGTATDVPAAHEETAEDDQAIMDVLAAMFPPTAPAAPANSEEKDEIKRESPAEDRPQSPLKRMRSAEDDTTADQREEKRVKTDAEHARELEEELKRIFQSASSNPVDSMDTAVADETIEPGDHSMLDADSQIIDHLNGHFGDHEAHDLANGVLDGFHSDFVLEGIDGENTLHSDPNGTPDLTMSETPTHKKSIWDPNPKHFTRQMHYIPTLGTVAYDVLRALSERSFETVIGGINPKENGEETEVFKEYRSLKSFFYDLREKISDEFPLLYPDQLDIVDTGEQEILRVANLATICSSIFGANELGWPDLDSNFLLAFVPKSKPMTSEVADLYIGLKTQMYLDLLENEQDANRETLLKRLFVDGVETSLKQRHPDVPLVGAEKDFLANCNARKTLLLEESSDPAKIVELKDQKYPYDSFLQSINVYISNCIETIENLATRRNSISFDMENFSFDDGLDGHDLGDLETLMAEAASRAAQASVDEKETSAAGIDELAALLSDGITRNSQQQQSHPPTTTASGLSPTALALDESALRAKTLALDSIQQNQYRPTVSPQPSAKPTTYHNPQQHQTQPQQPHPPYYQYNQQPAANAQASHNAASSDGDLPPNQTERTPVLYERARQAAAARSSNHARREGSHSTRRPWSADEEKALMMGLDMVKGPHWSQILTLFGPNGNISNILADRTQVQLKDKARNLKLFFLKTSSEMPYYLQCVTGELKTRAPTQAARKEAEEKSRLNSQEEQERINGIMALGNMQTNGAQRSNPALVGQRSATPTQPPQGGFKRIRVPTGLLKVNRQPRLQAGFRLVNLVSLFDTLRQLPSLTRHLVLQHNRIHRLIPCRSKTVSVHRFRSLLDNLNPRLKASSSRGCPKRSSNNMGYPPLLSSILPHPRVSSSSKDQCRARCRTASRNSTHRSINNDPSRKHSQLPRLIPKQTHNSSHNVFNSQFMPVPLRSTHNKLRSSGRCKLRDKCLGLLGHLKQHQEPKSLVRLLHRLLDKLLDKPRVPHNMPGRIQPFHDHHSRNSHRLSCIHPRSSLGYNRELRARASNSSQHKRTIHIHSLRNHGPCNTNLYRNNLDNRALLNLLPKLGRRHSQYHQQLRRPPRVHYGHLRQPPKVLVRQLPERLSKLHRNSLLPKGHPGLLPKLLRAPRRLLRRFRLELTHRHPHKVFHILHTQLQLKPIPRQRPELVSRQHHRPLPRLLRGLLRWLQTNKQPELVPQIRPSQHPDLTLLLVSLWLGLLQLKLWRKACARVGPQPPLVQLPANLYYNQAKLHCKLCPGQVNLRQANRVLVKAHLNLLDLVCHKLRLNRHHKPLPVLHLRLHMPLFLERRHRKFSLHAWQIPSRHLRGNRRLRPRVNQGLKLRRNLRLNPNNHCRPGLHSHNPRCKIKHNLRLNLKLNLLRRRLNLRGLLNLKFANLKLLSRSRLQPKLLEPRLPNLRLLKHKRLNLSNAHRRQLNSSKLNSSRNSAPQQPQQQQPRQQQPQAQPSTQPQTQPQAQSQAKPPQPPQQAPQRPLQPPAPQQHQLPNKPPTPQPSSQPPPPPQQPAQKTPEQRPQPQAQVPAPVSAPVEPLSEQHSSKTEPAKDASPDLDTLFFLKEAMEREQQDARDKEARDKEAEALRVALLAIEGAGGGSGGA
ncbi:hypothetical protein PG995_014337 [Apiospora arundinis]